MLRDHNIPAFSSWHGNLVLGLVLAALTRSESARAEELGAPYGEHALENRPSELTRAPDPIPIEPPHEQAKTERWAFRLGAAAGIPLGSQQETFLHQEGYSGGLRLAFTLSVSWSLGETVALGPWLAYGARSATAKSLGTPIYGTPVAPVYGEQDVLAALEISLTIARSRLLRFSLNPVVGVGTGQVNFYGNGRWQVGPVVGASLVLFPRLAHVGCALGFYSLTLPPAGEVGGTQNLGMIYLELIGGADVE